MSVRFISHFLLASFAGLSVAVAGEPGSVAYNPFFFSVAPIYGSLDDSLGNINVATVVNNDGTIRSMVPAYDDRWGGSVSIGYALDAQRNNDVTLSYTSLRTKSRDQASIAEGSGTITNTLGQTVVKFESAILNGPASAQFDHKLKYQKLELLATKRYPSNHLKPVTRSHFFGIQAVQFKRPTTVSYAGVTGSPGQEIPLQSTISYDNTFDLIGPRVGFGAVWDVFQSVGIGGDFSFSILGGRSKYSWNESTVAEQPIRINQGTLQTSSTPNFKQSEKLTSVVPALGGNIFLTSHLDFQENRQLKIDLGYSAEWYNPMSRYKISRSGGNEKVNINNRFAITQAYIKLTGYV